jgi:hypothetical protein
MRVAARLWNEPFGFGGVGGRNNRSESQNRLLGLTRLAESQNLLELTKAEFKSLLLVSTLCYGRHLGLGEEARKWDLNWWTAERTSDRTAERMHENPKGQTQFLI